MFKYWGFGLYIASEIAFPELLPADFTEADITITTGKTPETPEGEIIKKKAFSVMSKDEYLLHIKNICKYYVCYGKKIVVEPIAGIDERSLRLFLLGTVMAAIIYQRGGIPLHASAIVNNGKLIIFAGNSGAGKSTLIATLAAKGYEIFTDDICVMQQNEAGSEVVCSASYPMLKLWENAIAELDNSLYSKDFKVRPQLPKYGQFFYETFNTAALPVDKIFILNAKHPVNEITVKEITGIKAFRQLELQAYKRQFISSTKLRGVHFSILSQLTANASVYEVSRPTGGTTVEQLCENLVKFF